MAQYITLSYLQEKFPDYSFGTAGTCFYTISQGTRIIESVSVLIDYELQNIYGTIVPVFGTNANGTLDVPELIKDICADMSMGIMMNNRSIVITPDERNWGTMIYQRGWEKLQNLKLGKYFISDNYAGTISRGNLPYVSGMECQVRGEAITLSGTLINFVNYRTIIKNSLIVYGTSPYGTRLYAEGTDYKAFYYNQNQTGNWYGGIYRLESGKILDGETVLIDYKYKPSRIFYINDYVKWGEGKEEDRG